MTLYEKQQTQWQNRLQQERRNISVSVEETLFVDTDEQCLVSDEGRGGSEAATQQSTSGKNIALIPPRLSLQSKELPSVRPGSFVQSATAATAAHAVYQQEQRQGAPQTNIFARIAQRFTSSFAAFTSSPIEQVQPSVPSIPPSNVPASIPRPHESRPVDVREHQEAALATQSHVQDAAENKIVKVIDAIPATPSTRPMVAHQRREPQRLARHTTKIRLQTPLHPQTTPLPAAQQTDAVREVQESLPQQTPSREGYSVLREPLVIAVRTRDVSQVSTRPDLVACSHQERYEHDEPVREARELDVHETIFGTHVFESGQAEVMILQDKVQSSSVVHITLTSNPGQTLVQYVSLHPQAGFTLHLTAPASTRTTFNYALLAPAIKA